MHVLQISASVSPLHGGPPEFALNLNRALRAHGCRARILTSDALLTDTQLRTLRETFPEGALHLCRSDHRVAEKLEWFRALRTNLRDRPIVHIHGYYLWQTAAAALMCRTLRVPYLVHCHGIFEPYQARRARAKKAVFNALVGRWLLGRAAGLVFDTVAEQRAAVLPLRLNGLRSFVIPPCPAHDTPLATAGHPDPDPDPGPGPAVLFLARIAPIKRVDLVIAALPSILESHPSARLYVAGDDSDGLAADAIQQLPPACRPAVHLEGFVQGDDKAALLARSSVFVLPSENENFGISVAEALVAAVPVVISRAVGLAPSVERAGAGVVLDDLTVEAVAAGVHAVLDDPTRYSLMREAAHQLGRSLYNAQASVEVAQMAYATAAHTGTT